MFGTWPKLTLARIWGVPVRVDATFALVPFIFLRGLSTETMAAHWPLLTAVIGGVFLSVLLHELGHALTAKAQRVGVDEVVVGGFYGYASIRQRGATRGALVRILAAGPLANLIIFLLLWLALSMPSLAELMPRGAALSRGGADNWPEAAARMLALVNLAMFVFNLLPAFPLDGGRILGHLLDEVMSMVTSARIVSGLGIALGLALVLLGFGFGMGIILTIVGILVVMTNLSRLNRIRLARGAGRG